MKSPEIKGSSINYMGGQSSYMDEMKKMASKMYGKVQEKLSGKSFSVQGANIAGAMAEPSSAPTPEFNVSKRQIGKTIATVIAEAATEGNQGMQAVLNTMVNRTKVNPKYYGENIFDVVSKDSQYSAFSVDDPNYKEVLDYYDGKIKNISPLRKTQIMAVEGMIELAKKGKLDDITQGSTHYWNPDKAASYSWMSEIQNPIKIGNHMFGYLYK